MKMFEFRLISLEFISKGLINNITAMVQIMAWSRLGDKPLSEPMMVSLPTHIYTSLDLNELITYQIKSQYKHPFHWLISWYF